MNASGHPTRALLVSRDLFFSSRISGTASELGLPMDVEGNFEQVLAKVASGNYCCLFIDLTVPELDIAQLTASLAEEQRPKIIAFGPHVDTARLQQAREAGCDEVLPRSRFTSMLPELLRRCL